MKICIIAGARPNFVKVAPIIKELIKRDIDYYLVNTGQHYDENMAKVFYDELEIPKPNYDLDVRSGTHAEQTAKIMIGFEKILFDEDQTSLVLVVGDVNSTLACSIVAKKLHIPVAHVEAGLRSFDNDMPEEINRLVTDVLTDLYLIHSQDAVDNLKNEGVKDEKIKYVGNVMIDSLLNNMDKIDKSEILKKLNLNSRGYGLITMHRPSNVDDKEILNNIISLILSKVALTKKIVFPVHPRTLSKLKEFDLFEKLEANENIILTEPLGYIDFQKLMKEASFILSDSGGVQEETTMYKTPCLTLRNNTERPVCIYEGSTELVNLSNLERFLDLTLKDEWKESSIPKYWDGKTAERIVNEIEVFCRNE